MKTLLTIGSSHFILPASTNINAFLAALQKAQPVRLEWKEREGYFYYPIIGEGDRYRAAVKIEMIQDDQYIDTKKLKRLPEQASPDAHNTF